MTSPVQVIRNVGELVTCDPARGESPGVIRDAALMATDGVLTYVGPASGLPLCVSSPSARACKS